MKVGIKVLGCDKNTVESEYLAGALKKRGHNPFLMIEEDVNEFDVIVILTCGFIEDARDESRNAIDSILSSRKRKSETPRVVVAGCMPQVFHKEMQRAFPHADAMVGIVDIDSLVNIIEEVSLKSTTPTLLKISSHPRVLVGDNYVRLPLQKAPYSFLRIADGCSHRCTFCLIPRIKGKYQSVKKEILIREAKDLVRQGTREINLIAQDITLYGRDRYGDRYGLEDLLKDLCTIKGDFWIRLLYCYPTSVPKSLLELIAGERKICNYIDIPLQHLDEQILRAMGRPHSWQRIRSLVDRIREIVPDVTIRSTFIVGFPGETYRHFKIMKRRLKELSLERVGFFIYSYEEETPSADLPRHVMRWIAQRRLEHLAEVQKTISMRANKRWVGSKKEVLVEARFPGTDYYIGRTETQAPEIDGFVYFSSPKKINPGEFVKVGIIRADPCDLYGAIV